MCRLRHEAAVRRGADLLLEAWAEVAPGHHAWRLRLYGAGPEEDALRRRTAEPGLDASVESAGRLPSTSV